MKKLLSELIAGNSVLIETDDLPEFLDFSIKQDSYYSYRFEYSETLVKITMTGKEIIIKLKTINHES